MKKQGILKNASPSLQFFLLLLLIVIGLIVGTAFSIVTVWTINGGQISMGQTLSSLSGSLKNLVVAQIISQLFTFLLPPLCFSYLISGSLFGYFLGEDKKNPKKYFVGFAIILLAGFFLQLLIIDKESFIFPDWLKGLEISSMRTQATYDSFVKQLIGIKGAFNFSVVFVMIAILPAIGEELLFRGVIQKSIAALTKTEWPAIIISGVLFGLMHMEFFNFFALCFMGFVLGTLYSFTKNIWLTIFLHFMNNAISFITLYFYQNGTSKFDPEQKLPLYIPLIAGVAMLILFYMLHKKKFEITKGETIIENTETTF